MADNTFDYKPEASKSGSLFIDIVQTIVVAMAITVVVYLFIATPHQVDGQSMEPNYQNGDLLLTNKIIQIIGNTSIGENMNYDYQRGDVIIFQKPDKKDFIKRIIAGPNDTIQFEDPNIIVNGEIIKENYIPNTPDYSLTLPEDPQSRFLEWGQTEVVPENKFFVMGDNRQNSQDSRYASVGWVDRSEIKGKVFIRYWPLESFGLISRGTYETVSINSNQE
jgi:signal peptidase I